MSQEKSIKLTRQVVVNESVFTVFSDGESERYIQAEDFEASAIAFHCSPLSDCSYIRTMSQIFIAFLKSSGYAFIKCCIDSYRDDIGYCKITLNKSGKNIYFMCSITDGIILSELNGISLHCNEQAWNEMDLFEVVDNLENN